SRRRHTRSKRDWSSDVCSSDLAHAGAAQDTAPPPTPNAPAQPTPGTARSAHSAPSATSSASATAASSASPAPLAPPTKRTPPPRAEERRVGKDGKEKWRANESE